MSKFPTTLSELSFQCSLDQASNKNIYKTLSDLRKSTLSIPNRLLSILQDAAFIEALHNQLQQHCPLNSCPPRNSLPSSQESAITLDDSTTGYTGAWPLIPNERSGSWPLSPQLKVRTQQQYLTVPHGQSHPQPISAYFKSTDGHVNQWAFSSRRLNLPVLELLGSAGGAILIDTTRRGKAYPDALRRTVPMFTAVWNRALFGGLAGTGVLDFQGFGLEEGEISQIESRLPTFVQDLRLLGLPMEEIKRKVKRPVRCLWVSQPSSCAEWDDTCEDLTDQIKAERRRWDGVGGVNVLICCSASRRVLGAEMSDEDYIQGAGDDSEGWSQGLTAKTFWNHRNELVKSIEAGDNMENLVRVLVQRDNQCEIMSSAVLVKPTENLYLSTSTRDIGSFDLVIDCNSAPNQDNHKFFGLGCKEAKLGSKMLREALPTAAEAVKQTLRKSARAQILVRCSTGKDLSVGVVLTVLCRFYNDGGKHVSFLVSALTTDIYSGTIQLEQDRQIDKQLTKQRLAWITSSKPDANPSRATLQAVNSVLMDRSK